MCGNAGFYVGPDGAEIENEIRGYGRALLGFFVLAIYLQVRLYQAR
jgi:hypothetical protein